MPATPEDTRVESGPFRRGWTLATWALWMALVSGLGQAAVVAVLRMSSDRLILISPEVVWMAPLANALVFAIAGAVVLVVSLRWPAATAVRLMMTVFVFLLVLGPLLNVPRIHPSAKLLLALGLGFQLARMLAGRFGVMDFWIRRSLPVLLGICVAFAVGLPTARFVNYRSTQAALPPVAPGAPNVILVVLDTVRASSLGLYGYGRPTSPHLDRVATSGVVFDRAFAPSSWTLPSHASMFTGRLPQFLSADWLRPLDTTDQTLAEAFAARGYATAGFTANLLYSTAETGLDRGFHTYADYPLSAGMILRESWLARPIAIEARNRLGMRQPLVVKRASSVNAEFERWLASRPTRPFFAFLNFFDAHAPYLPPPPFDAKFGEGGPRPDPMVRRQWSAEEIQRSQDAYDGALAYVDQELGRLFERLRTSGLEQDTLVVVTSDHGEQFGEHGLFDHGNGLYRQVLHVPLVIRFPGRVPAGVRIATPVSLVDLGKTLLDLAAGDTSPSVFPGRSLAGHWLGGGHAPPDQPLFAEIRRGINLPPWLPASKGTMQSVVIDGVHYIRNGDGSEEMYDLNADPAETSNLAGRPDAEIALKAARQALVDLLGRR